jgi:SAM-dependent methyltransferase
MKVFAKKMLFKTITKIRRNIFARKCSKESRYRSVTLTCEEIEQGIYKKYFGGGPGGWESRGAFQLYFLQKMGMTQNSKVLDIGCGPGRAGKHLIGFLDKDNYCGIDNNTDFIKAASVMVKKEKLVGKKAKFFVVDNFDLKRIGKKFDYVLAFSLLNHCNTKERAAFFKKIHDVLTDGGKIYISHARWFDISYIENSAMRPANQFGRNDFDVAKFGWGPKDGVFPIIELRKK